MRLTSTSFPMSSPSHPAASSANAAVPWRPWLPPRFATRNESSGTDAPWLCWTPTEDSNLDVVRLSSHVLPLGACGSWQWSAFPTLLVFCFGWHLPCCAAGSLAKLVEVSISHSVFFFFLGWCLPCLSFLDIWLGRYRAWSRMGVGRASVALWGFCLAE